MLAEALFSIREWRWQITQNPLANLPVLHLYRSHLIQARIRRLESEIIVGT